MVSSLARRMIRDPEVAREAAQDAWVAVVAGLEDFRGESRLSTWVYSVAARAILRAAKRERLHTTRMLREYFHGPAREFPSELSVEREVWVKSMCDACLTGMLHCLDNPQRLAYILRDMVGMDYADIAAVLDSDEAAVRQVVSRGRRKLNHFLHEECVLKNPDAPCSCRMRRHVEDLDLPAEYQKLYATIGRASVLCASNELLLRPDHWQTLLDP